MNTRGPLKGDGNIFKCEWVLNLKQHFRQWCLRTWMIQHRYLTLWKLSLTFWGSFAPLGRITAKQWQPGTHRYLCIPHSLSFTAIKFLSLFIIYKIAKDFEKFSAQAPVLEGHKGAEEEEDAESSTLFPKASPGAPVMCRGCIPAHPTWKPALVEPLSFPSWVEKWLHRLTKVTMEKGSSSV